MVLKGLPSMHKDLSLYLTLKIRKEKINKEGRERGERGKGKKETKKT